MPWGIKDITYELTEEQKSRIPRLYEYDGDTLRDVTDTDLSWKQMNLMLNSYYSGAAVKLMSGEGISHNSVTRPGSFWGIGMSVKYAVPGMQTARADGSYGWSGEYGTHFLSICGHSERIHILFTIRRN